jgi:hypothetical protein
MAFRARHQFWLQDPKTITVISQRFQNIYRPHFSIASTGGMHGTRVFPAAGYICQPGCAEARQKSAQLSKRYGATTSMSRNSPVRPLGTGREHFRRIDSFLHNPAALSCASAFSIAASHSASFDSQPFHAAPAVFIAGLKHRFSCSLRKNASNPPAGRSAVRDSHHPRPRNMLSDPRARSARKQHIVLFICQHAKRLDVRNLATEMIRHAYRVRHRIQERLAFRRTGHNVVHQHAPVHQITSCHLPSIAFRQTANRADRQNHRQSQLFKSRLQDFNSQLNTAPMVISICGRFSSPQSR